MGMVRREKPTKYVYRRRRKACRNLQKNMMVIDIYHGLLIITREEWRSSQLISSTLLPKNKESATDKVSATNKVSAPSKVFETNKESAPSKVFATDKGSTREEVSAATNKVLASDEILATKKQRQRSTATFSFRGFMGNYR